MSSEVTPVEDPRVLALRQASWSRRWKHALKPASWSKLVVPSVLGQVVGATFEGRVSVLGVLLGFAFTLLDLVLVVCLNDWADQDVDAIKRRRFPEGCSPKTLPDGILPPKALLTVGVVASLGALFVAALGFALLERPSFGIWGALAVCLFWAYSLPPLRLNYRGGGELLEAVGVGVVLPLFHMSAQSGSAGSYSRLLLFALVPLALSSALASGLSDEQSDREGGKCTFATEVGNPATRTFVELSAAIGLGAFLAIGLLSYSFSWWTGALACGVGLSHYVRLRRVSPSAGTDAFPEQGRYKRHLHRLIAHSELVCAAGLIVERSVV